MKRLRLILKSRHLWVIACVLLVVVIFVYSTYGMFARIIVNNYLYPYPTESTLDMSGRKVLEQTPGGLILHSYGEGNTDTATLIPGSKGAGNSTIILDNGTVVWNKITENNKSYELWKYSSSSTERILSIPILDLAQYGKDYESGVAISLSDVQHMTGYIYDGPLKKYANDEFAFLDVLPINGNGKNITELRISRHTYNENGVLMNKSPVFSVKDFRLYFYSENFPGGGEYRPYISIELSSERRLKFYDKVRPHFSDDALFENNNHNDLIKVISYYDTTYATCKHIFMSDTCTNVGYIIDRAVILSGSSTSTLIAFDHYCDQMNPGSDQDCRRERVTIKAYSEARDLVQVGIGSRNYIVPTRTGKEQEVFILPYSNILYIK